jgi:hypothetical protein
MTEPKESSDNSETKEYLFPLLEGDGSTTLFRIIALSKGKIEKALTERSLAGQSLSGKEPSINLDDFYTLQDMADVLKYDIELSGKNKTTEALNDAYVEMLDIRKNGMKKKGYLYPVFLEKGGRLKAKILIAVALDNKPTPVSKYRPFFFKHTRFSIEPFIKNFDDSHTNKYYTNPEISLLQKKENGVEFNPYGLSLLEDLREEIKQAFPPFAHLEIPDFYQDMHNFIRSEDLLKIVNERYYIFKRPVSLNPLGEPKVEPEVHFHYLSLISIMEELVTSNLLTIAAQYGLDVSKSHIKDYSKKYPKITSRNIKDYQERVTALSEIVNKFNITPKMNKLHSGLVSSLKTGFEIIKDLNKSMKEVEAEISFQKNKQAIDTVIDSIETHLSNTKTLFIFNPKSPFPESYDSKKVPQEVVKQIQEMVLEKYHFFESREDSGEKIYYLLSPKYCLKVVVNLATLFQKEEKYKFQYKIAKLLREKMIHEGAPHLDSSLDPSQKKKLEESLIGLNRTYLESEEKEEIKKNFNNVFAYAGGSIYLIVLLYMYIFNNNTTLFIFSPFAIFIGYMTGRIFKKKKNQILNNNPHIDLNTGVTILPELKPIIPILTETIFSAKTKADEIVMDLKDLQYYFSSNLSQLMSKNLSLFQNVPEEKSIEFFNEVARSISVVIRIPKSIHIKTLPDEYYIYKEFLKDNFKKSQVLELYKNKMKQSRDSKNTEETRYYKYLLEILECDFSNI